MASQHYYEELNVSLLILRHCSFIYFFPHFNFFDY